MTDRLRETDRTVPVMIYTPNRLTWGKLVHPEGVRPQLWLKMPLAPEYFKVLDTSTIIFGSSKNVRMDFPETHIPISQILAFHMQPPFEVELDYDPEEPNRAMKHVVLSVDIFRIEGNIRISTMVDFAASIQGTKGAFRSFYDVTISHPLTPQIKPLHVPIALIRSDHMLYMIKE